MKKMIAVFALALVVLISAPIAHAQAVKMRRVGMMFSGNPSGATSLRQAFKKELRRFGWIEEKNVSFVYRYANGDRDRIPYLAAELLGLKVDLIVVQSGLAVRAITRVNKEIPVVMGYAANALKHVASLARPGGNVTGMSMMTDEWAGKHVELLKESVPGLSRLAVLWLPRNGASRSAWKRIQLVARGLGIQLYPVEIWNAGDFDKAFAEVARVNADAVLITIGRLLGANQKRIANFAVKNRLPSIFGNGTYTKSGGFLAYSPNRVDLYRRSASHVNKILRGAKPADLPVERPMKFDLIVNLKTAKKIGITIPPEVLLRATKVIK